MEKFTIEDLKNGKCAVRGETSITQAVVSAAWPNDVECGGNSTYCADKVKGVWYVYEVVNSSLPIQDAADFVLPGEEESNVKLTNLELITKCEEWVSSLCKTGGRSWSLRVPVDFSHDPDVLFSELIKRFNHQIK